MGEIACGTYIGNNQLTQTVTLAFSPTAVLVWKKAITEDEIKGGIYGGLAVLDSPLVGTKRNILEISGNGFTVAKGGNAATNIKDVVYNYVAMN